MNTTKERTWRTKMRKLPTGANTERSQRCLLLTIVNNDALAEVVNFVCANKRKCFTTQGDDDPQC